jgi:hypothetical protein
MIVLYSSTTPDPSYWVCKIFYISRAVSLFVVYFLLLPETLFVIRIFAFTSPCLYIFYNFIALLVVFLSNLFALGGFLYLLLKYLSRPFVIAKFNILGFHIE